MNAMHRSTMKTIVRIGDLNASKFLPALAVRSPRRPKCQCTRAAIISHQSVRPLTGLGAAFHGRAHPQESETAELRYLPSLQLKAWCAEHYGRQAEVAEAIGVSRQVVTDWLKGRAIPSLDNGLALQRFLKKQRRRGSGPKD
jgi:DNA-binding XRE family transcriptional regulator